MSNGPISAVGQSVRLGTLGGLSQGNPAEGAPSGTAPGTPPVPVSAAHEQAVKPDVEAVKKAAESINAFIKSTQRNLEISVDKDTGIVVVKVVDKESGEVIRQIPAEETLAIAKHLDSVQGVLFRSKV